MGNHPKFFILILITLIISCFTASCSSSSKNSYTWRIGKQKRHIDLINMDVNDTYIRRNDGFTIFEEGMGREHQQDFRCESPLGNFKFTANRWDVTDKPTDTYRIFDAYWPFINIPPIPHSKKALLILFYTKEIEYALLHIPPHRFFNGKYPKRVLFYFGNYPKRPYPVQAKDLNNPFTD